jgi:hypothetical protein
MCIKAHTIKYLLYSYLIFGLVKEYFRVQLRAKTGIWCIYVGFIFIRNSSTVYSEI